MEEDSIPRAIIIRLPDEKWLKFVAANRKGQNVSDEYDVISGPVANDQTMPVIDLYSRWTITIRM